MRRLAVLVMAAGAAFGGMVTVQSSGVPRHVETGEHFLPSAAAEGSRESGIGSGRAPTLHSPLPVLFGLDSFPAPGSGPFGLAFDGANLWHVDLSAQTVYALDPATGSVRRSFSAPDQWSKGLCWDGQYLWVTGNNASRIYKVDTVSGSVVLNFAAPGSNPAGLAFDGTHLWCADINSDQSKPSFIFKLNPANGARLDSLEAPCRMVADMDWDGTRLWVSDMDNGVAYALDPADGKVVKATGTPGPQPTGLAFIAGRIAVADFETGRIYTFHPDSGPAATMIDSPAYWEVIPTWRNPAIIGTVAGLGLDSFRLEYGAGANPSEWTAVGPAALTPKYRDTLGTWNVSGITQAGEYCLRIKAFFGSSVDTGRVNRLGVDPQIAPNWPQTYTNVSAIACADIAECEKYEVIAGIEHQDFRYNKLGAWCYDGSPSSGFPVPDISLLQMPAAIGDVNHDGRNEIATGFDLNHTQVNLVRGNGSVMPGWPQEGGLHGNLYYLGVTALADVNSDALLEVFSGGGRLSAWDTLGTALSGWPKSVEFSTPAVADLDRDGAPELIALRADSLYVFEADGAVAAGWPRNYGGAGGSVFPVVGDINQDNRIEVVFTIGAKLYCVNDSGRVLAGFPKTLAGAYANSPVLGDLDHDGFAEIVVVSGTFPNNSVVQVVRHDGSVPTGWPRTLSGFVFRAFNAPSLGDVDGDGYADVVMGFEGVNDGFELLYAWKRDGSAVAGWPRLLRDIDGYGITGSPVLADMNADGQLECAISSNAYWIYRTDIYVWNLGVPYSADDMEWPTYRHDPQMTACWTPASSGVEDGPKPPAASHKPKATIVRGVLFLPEARGEKREARSGLRVAGYELRDIVGRKVLDLHAGANDVRHLAPGVYFVRSAVSGERSAVAVRKVVVQR
jgi:DNA-binding beta-propeller fold protein YncE